MPFKLWALTFKGLRSHVKYQDFQLTQAFSPRLFRTTLQQSSPICSRENWDLSRASFTTFVSDLQCSQSQRNCALYLWFSGSKSPPSCNAWNQLMSSNESLRPSGFLRSSSFERRTIPFDFASIFETPTRLSSLTPFHYRGLTNCCIDSLVLRSLLMASGGTSYGNDCCLSGATTLDE
ncbi:uncharacterized protein [Dermacentor albipictus]|uniref:uncharacterized protein n=1 Tax=Dermacentor albipictus TaxID=60249 RepID=UPI0038FC889C